jgi:hypothetical protein
MNRLNARAGWNNLTGAGVDTHNVLFGSQAFGSEMRLTINGKVTKPNYFFNEIFQNRSYEEYLISSLINFRPSDI